MVDSGMLSGSTSSATSSIWATHEREYRVEPVHARRESDGPSDSDNLPVARTFRQAERGLSNLRSIEPDSVRAGVDESLPGVLSGSLAWPSLVRTGLAIALGSLLLTLTSCDRRPEDPPSSSASDSKQDTPAPPHAEVVPSAPALSEDDLRAYAALAYDVRRANTEAARRAIKESGMSIAIVDRINAMIEEVTNSIQAENQTRLDELRAHAAQGGASQLPRASEPNDLRVDSLLFGSSASDCDAAIVKRWLGPLGVFVGLSDKQRAEAESLRSAFAAAGWSEREKILWSLCRLSDGPYPVGPIPEIHASLFHPGIRVRAATELRHSIGLSPMSVDVLIDAAGRADSIDADYKTFSEAVILALSKVELGELVARLATEERSQATARSRVLARAALLRRHFRIEDLVPTGTREQASNLAINMVAFASARHSTPLSEEDLTLIAASSNPEVRLVAFVLASATPSVPPWMTASLVSAMADEDPLVRRAAVVAASSLRGRGHDEPLVSGLASILQTPREGFDRTLVLHSLANFGSAAVPSMLKELQDGTEEDKLAVLAAIAQPGLGALLDRKGPGPWLEVFNEALTDPSPRVRRTAFVHASHRPQDFRAGELEHLWIRTVTETRAQLDGKLVAGSPTPDSYWRDESPFVALPLGLRLSAQQRQIVIPDLVKLLQTFDRVSLTGGKHAVFTGLWSSLCRCGPESAAEVEQLFRDASDDRKEIMIEELHFLGRHGAPLVPMLTTLSQRNDQLGERAKNVLQLLEMER